MNRTRNARIAGFSFLFYIAVSIAGRFAFGEAAGSGAASARLASIVANGGYLSLAILFMLVTVFLAFILGVTLYAVTREEDPEIAVLALSCRVGEGVVNAVLVIGLIALLSVANSSQAATGDPGAAHALGALLLKLQGWGTLVAASMFAVGSTLFSYLFLRARSLPASLAWLGIVASALLVIVLPAQLVGAVKGMLTYAAWMPMLVFELLLGGWLLFKGVAALPAGQPERTPADVAPMRETAEASA